MSFSLKKMKILHSYCLNHNVGDYALGIGLKNIFRHYLDVELFAETNLQGTVFNEYYINEVVNKKYDLLVIGGGGIIHGAHWPNGWFWLIEKKLIKTIKIPFVIYAAGYNYFKREEGIPENGIEHLKETIRYASFFSVRNDGSCERLNQHAGISALEIPDSGFHINLNTEYSRLESSPYVIIQLANDKSELRFEGSKATFIDEMQKVVKYIAAAYKVIFIPHVYEDISLCEMVAKGIRNCRILKFGEYAFDHSEKVIAYYKYAEYVLAMRGHAQIIPIAFNTPVVTICNHPKHRDLMGKLGINGCIIDVIENQFGEKTIQLIEHILENRAVLFEQYLRINNEIGDRTSNAMLQIKNNI